MSVYLLHIEPNLDVCFIILFLRIRDASVVAVSVKVIRNSATGTHFYLLRYYGLKKNCFISHNFVMQQLYGVHPKREMTFAAVYFSSFALDTLHNLGTSVGEHCCSRPMQQDGFLYLFMSRYVPHDTLVMQSFVDRLRSGSSRSVCSRHTRKVQTERLFRRIPDYRKKTVILKFRRKGKRNKKSKISRYR